MAMLLSLSGLAAWAISRTRPSIPVFCLVLVALLGGWAGANEAHRSGSVCTESLTTGDRVAVAGTVANRIGPGAGSRRLLRMRNASVVHDDRMCVVERFLARVRLSATAPSIGAQVQVDGEWMRFDDGGGLVTGVLTVRDSITGGSMLLAARRALSDRMDSRLPPDVTPTAQALLFAERDEMDPMIRREFAAAGMAHLLAVSGMHVGMLAVGLTWCLRILRPGRRRPVTVLLLTGYVLMIGAPVAARRALILLTGYYWATGRGWPARPGELLGLAGLLILAADPSSLLDAGFQLSFAGFSGVLVGLRLWGPNRGGLPRACAASSCAQFATSPFTAWHFGQVTPIGLLSHLLAGPLVAASLASLAAVVVLPAPLWSPGAHIATGSIRLLAAIARWFAAVPMGHLAVGPPGLGTWVVWLLMIWAGLRLLRLRTWRATVAPLLLATPTLVLAPIQAVLRPPHALLCTLSVGQGDAAVLRTHGGHWMVFDGGPATRSWSAGDAILLPFLRRHGASRVDLALLSHPDLDHVGGLITLLGSMEVARVMDSGDPLPSPPYRRFLELVDSTGSLWLPAVSGDSLTVDGVRIIILGPARDTPDGARTANETSVVFRLEFAGGFSYLNSGDASIAEEEALLREWPPEVLRSDLFKVGHHGSRTSSSVSFVRAVSPSVAVISTGARNPYGHPHAEALARLRTAGVPRIWRTDRHGSLCIEIDREGRWRIADEAGWRDPGSSP